MKNRTITLPPTATAAQSNRWIQTRLLVLKENEAGGHKDWELRAAIEDMHLRSVNQVRATQGKAAVKSCPGFFAGLRKLEAQKGKAPARQATQIGQCFFCGKVGVPVYNLGHIEGLDRFTCGCQTDYFAWKAAPPVTVKPARLAVVDSAPQMVKDLAPELAELKTRLEACPDRSSPEARKIRKQIRTIKDRLGIPR